MWDFALFLAERALFVDAQQHRRERSPVLNREPDRITTDSVPSRAESQYIGLLLLMVRLLPKFAPTLRQLVHYVNLPRKCWSDSIGFTIPLTPVSCR